MTLFIIIIEIVVTVFNKFIDMKSISNDNSVMTDDNNYFDAKEGTSKNKSSAAICEGCLSFVLLMSFVYLLHY